MTGVPFEADGFQGARWGMTMDEVKAAIATAWPDFATTRGRVTAPGELILFAGRDFHGGGVEIRVGGVALDVELPGAVRKQEHRAAPAGPAHLRKSLVADIDHPDIYTIPPGAF